jgi:hypothetical protein
MKFGGEKKMHHSGNGSIMVQEGPKTQPVGGADKPAPAAADTEEASETNTSFGGGNGGGLVVY